MAIGGGKSVLYPDNMDEECANEMLEKAVLGTKLNFSTGKGFTRYNIGDVKRALDHGAKVTVDILMVAVSCNMPVIVKLLLDAGGNPNAVPTEEFGPLGGGTLLAYAVNRGCVETVNVLLEGGALPDGHEDDWVTPLMWAGYRNQPECALALLDAGADVNLSDVLGRSPLYLACADGGCELVELLLERGANVHIHDSTGVSPLMSASRYGMSYWRTGERRSSVAQLLLDAGADPNHADSYGNTALLLATDDNMTGLDESGNIEEMNIHVRQLLDAGGDVNAVGWQGTTALMNACRSKQDMGERMIDMLLGAGADINAADVEGMTPLMIAAGCNTETVVRLLLREGADVNKQNALGTSALIMAASENHCQVVEALIEHGADLETCDNIGTTALMATFAYVEESMVTRASRREVASTLIAAGAHVNHADRDGNTALLLAVEHTYTGYMMGDAFGEEMVKQLTQLLSAGANVNVVGSGGSTTLIHVCRTQTYRGGEMVKLLLDHGADVNAVDDSGMTPLLMAVRWNTPAVVAMLLERGADVRAVNNDGNNAAQLVGLEEPLGEKIAVLLIRAGVDFTGVDLAGYGFATYTWDTCKTLRMQLKYLCREQVRSCVMRVHPGQYIDSTIWRLGLPPLLIEYVKQEHRYNLHCDEWMD